MKSAKISLLLYASIPFIAFSIVSSVSVSEAQDHKFIYEQNYQTSVVKGKILTSSLMLEDAYLLKHVLLDIHPGIYRYNTVEEFEKNFDQFISKLNVDMTEAEYMKHLAQYLETIRCGHTYVNPWNMKKEIRDRLFGANINIPFGFIWIDKKMIITHNASENGEIKVGAEITSINGISGGVIFDSLYTVAKVDGNNLQAKASVMNVQRFEERGYTFFDMYFPLFFPFESEVFEFEVRNPNQSIIIKYQERGKTRSERASIIAERYKPIPSGKDSWQLEFADSSTAVLSIGTFATWNFQNFNHSIFFDSVFTAVNSSGSDNLVIDIRGNAGGLGEPRDELLSYLIKDPIECSERSKVLIRNTRADTTYQKHVNTWENIFFSGLPQEYYSKYNDRYFELHEKSCNRIEPKPNRFEGNIVVYGNQSNVSATFTLLRIVQEQNIGTYVGQPSGGNTQGINGGSYFFLYLPNTGFEVDIPLKHFATFDKKDGPLRPDVEVSLVADHIANNIDPYLVATRDFLKEE